MKIDEACINHNAVRIIGELTENIYSFCDENTEQNRMYMAMTLGEIAGVIDMAKALKEVLNTHTRILPSGLRQADTSTSTRYWRRCAHE